MPACSKRQPRQCPKCVLDPFWLQRPNIVISPRLPLCLHIWALLRGNMMLMLQKCGENVTAALLVAFTSSRKISTRCARILLNWPCKAVWGRIEKWGAPWLPYQQLFVAAKVDEMGLEHLPNTCHKNPLAGTWETAHGHSARATVGGWLGCWHSCHLGGRGRPGPHRLCFGGFARCCMHHKLESQIQVGH